MINTLSPKEKEVLRYLMEGHSNPTIAQLLGKSLHTVKRQVQIMLNKTGMDNRTQLAMLAQSEGFSCAASTAGLEDKDEHGN